MSTFGEDEDVPDEAVLEQKRREYLERSKGFGGRPPTKEELEEENKRRFAEGAKFPDSDGSEIAHLMDNGNLDILFTSNSPEMKAHGNRVYKPGDADYDHYWKRHGFDQPKSKRHAIIKKWDDKTDDWIDLGDNWF
ncbi:hypothetical protein BH10CYA1_BH10CYA1_60100 [soil metagenome]